MPDYLSDRMKLEVVGDTPVPSTLDRAAKLVYQCALSNRSIGEAAKRCGLTRGDVFIIIDRLVNANLVNVKDPLEIGARTRRVDSATTAEQQQQFDGLQDTETFVERLEILFEACKKQNYYDLLGVEPDTPRAELRTRYFELSKRFHPDRAFKQEAKDRKDKMAVVFQRLTTAYETLSNRNKKAEYDASIAEELELRALERSLSAAVAQSKVTSNAPPNDATSSESRTSRTSKTSQRARASTDRNPTSASPDKPRSVPPEHILRTQRRISSSAAPKTPSTTPERQNIPNRTTNGPSARKKTTSIPSVRPSAGPKATKPHDVKRFRPSAPPRPDADIRRQEMKRKLAGRAMAELLSRRSVAPQAAINLEQSLEDALLAMDQERHSDAANISKTILKHYPNNEKAKQILNDAGRGIAQSQAHLHMRRSRYAIKDGQLEQAKWHLEQALIVDQNNMDARHQMAQLSFEREGDINRALSLMKEVIVLGGQRAKYFVTLGEIFLAMEDLARAFDAFNRALQLEPENREIKKKLKLCSR